MVHKERCVCDICTCGKHHCGPKHKFSSTGKLDLKSKGDIYVASKGSFEFPDTLNLFEGGQDLKSIAQKDYKGHLKVGVSRHHPDDQIELGAGKMAGVTMNTSHYPGYDMSLGVSAEDVKMSQSAPAPIGSKTKMDISTSYDDHYPGKNMKFQKSVPVVHKEELEGPSGDIDLSTINKKDYVAFNYGRPYLNSIPDNNLFGVSDKDVLSKSTSFKEHYPGFKSAPADKIKAVESDLQFGTDVGVKASVYGGDYQRVQPKVRKSKRRGTEVDFGLDFDHATSYKTQYESNKAGTRSKAATFADQLSLFEGSQDLKTIVRADYTGHAKVGVERHRPKDLIEIPREKMSSDTVTLAHYPVPVVTQETAKLTNAAAGVAAKGFAISDAMPSFKMESETSYKQHFPVKQSTKVTGFSYKDEIEPSTGEIDLGTVHKADYSKFSYGRPQINKIEDNNILGINYDLGRAEAGLTVQSLPPSRDSGIEVDVGNVAAVKASRSGVTSYGDDFAVAGGKKRTNKKQGTAVNFGRDFFGGTSYNDHYKSKQCLVPSLETLDEYTFKSIEKGHQIYSINCGCPPKGSCGCTPPPANPPLKA